MAGRASGGRGAPWLTRNVLVLSAVSLSQDAASELVYPILPILLTAVLGAPAVVVGLVEGLAEGAAAVTKYVAGRASDRLGRKPLVAAGYGMAALGKVVVALATVWPVVLLGRVVDRIGKGTRGAPRDALLVDAADPQHLGRVFGFHRAADTLGAVIGPLLGLLVLALAGGDVRVALWVAVAPAVLSVLLVPLAREQPTVRSAAPTRSAERDGGSARRRGPRTPLPARLRVVVAVLAAFSLVNFPDALVLLRLAESGFSATGVTAAYVLYNLVYAGLSYPAGALSDRWPPARVYALGLGCFAVGYTGLGLVGGGWAMLALVAVYGGFNGLTDGVGKAWVSSLAAPEQRGRAQGVFQGLTGGGVLVAGLWAGALWETGPGAGVVPLVVSGTLAALAAPVLWAAGRRLRR